MAEDPKPGGPKPPGPKRIDPEADFNAAVEHYQNGRMTEARHLAERVVSHVPNHSAAWHLLGVLHSATGNQANARIALEKAVRSNPQDSGAAYNLATLLAQLGEHKEAADNYRRSLLYQPDNHQARLGFAQSLRRSGRARPAIAEFRRLLEADPNQLAASLELADMLVTAGLPDQAVDALDSARAAHPGNPTLLKALVTIQKRLGRLEQAEDTAMALKVQRPDDPDVLALVGGILRDRGRPREAIAYCGEAIRRAPNSVDGHLNLAAALFDVGEFDGAVVCYSKVLDLQPNSADAMAFLGATRQVQGHLGAAIRLLRKAIAMRPEEPLAHFNLSMALLSVGRYREGWREYEWRWKTDRFRKERQSFREPLWDGGDLAGKRLLVWTEQGFGDAIQFLRYVPVLAAQGVNVALEIQPELKRLVRGLDGVEILAARGEKLPRFDCHVPLMSLPHLCGTGVTSVPAWIPYLKADRARIATWRERLASLPGFRIGLCWQGSIRHQANHLRSLEFANLAPLLDLPRVSAVNLQKGPGREQIAASGLADRLTDWTGEMDGPGEAFCDTAAVICGLDLVITVDTAIAHLAGALGRPVWLLLGAAPDFRWLLTREDSPWYPTLRIFRQEKQGQWVPVIERVRTALERRIAGGW
ncbi:MAG: tetratricopeptide repeat protein [Dongiaceae bacterium]